MNIAIVIATILLAVSVPLRGFLLLLLWSITDGIVSGLGEDRVSVPLRGFLLLLRCTCTAACCVGCRGFSPREGIFAFATRRAGGQHGRPAGQVSVPVRGFLLLLLGRTWIGTFQQEEFQSP